MKDVTMKVLVDVANYQITFLKFTGRCPKEQNKRCHVWTHSCGLESQRDRHNGYKGSRIRRRKIPGSTDLGRVGENTNMYQFYSKTYVQQMHSAEETCHDREHQGGHLFK